MCLGESPSVVTKGAVGAHLSDIIYLITDHIV